MLWFAVFKAWCAMGMDCSGQFRVAVFLVEHGRKLIGDWPIKLAAKFGNGQNALEIAGRAFNDGRWLVAVLLQPDHIFGAYIVNQDMVLVLGQRCIVNIFAAMLDLQKFGDFLDKLIRSKAHALAVLFVKDEYLAGSVLFHFDDCNPIAVCIDRLCLFQKCQFLRTLSGGLRLAVTQGKSFIAQAKSQKRR